MLVERYDGKTKKDDRKKYVLIAVGVVLIIILYKLLTMWIYNISHPVPDVVVAFGAATVTDFQEEDDMEALLKPYALDLDGNGKAVVDVIPYEISENEAMLMAGITDAGGEDGQASFLGCITEAAALLYITHEASMLDRYFNDSYLSELPAELASKTYPYCADISGCGMLEEQRLGRVPFYAGIRKGVTEEEYQIALNIIQAIIES